MGGINQFIVDIQLNGTVSNALQVPPPPVGITLISFDTFNDDQFIGMAFKQHVACLFSNARPLVPLIAMRLII